MLKISKKEEIIIQITKLAKEFGELPVGDSKEKRKLQKRIVKLKEQLLFEQYVELQSEEWKKDILGYEHFDQEGHDIIIKVNFTWGWLRVYRRGNSLEWY